MELLKKGDVVFLNEKEQTFPATEVQLFMDCNEGVVYMAEYRDEKGLLNKTFLCKDIEHEMAGIVNYVYTDNVWSIGDATYYDPASLKIIEDMINYIPNERIKLIRNH